MRALLLAGRLKVARVPLVVAHPLLRAVHHRYFYTFNAFAIYVGVWRLRSHRHRRRCVLML